MATKSRTAEARGDEDSSETDNNSAGNKFENDGSFFEMFQKQMQNQQNDSEKDKSKKKETSSDKLEPAYFSTQTISYKDSDKGTKKKTQYQVAIAPILDS